MDARVDSISIRPGASLDSVTMVMVNDDFGDEQTAFLPVKVVDATTGTYLFRGFVTQNEGSINASGHTQKVVLKDYKWLMSKRCVIRGKWYLNKGEVSDPAEGMGDGTSAGNQKYLFERFRSDFEEVSGYLQNEQLVFNQGGVPDCFIDNHVSDVRACFYMDTVDFTEVNGFPTTQWQKKTYSGYYWTWCTIIRHLYKYWIEPYNVSLAPVNLYSSDLTALAAIDADFRTPINYSIDNYNPLAALDYVVSSIPGQWMWYLEYSATQVLIRITELDTIISGNVTLTVGDAASKLVNSDANVTSVRVVRDDTNAVANVVGLGGKVKLVTTVQLVPLWQRYDTGGTYYDFQDASDFEAWRMWCKYYYKLDPKKQAKDIEGLLTGEQYTRFPKIYRYYGIPEEGEALGDAIISEDPGVAIDTVALTGDIATQYAALTEPVAPSATATLRDYFFRNAKIEREISPPEFARYGDKIQVFLYDSLYTRIPTDSSEAAQTQEDRGLNLLGLPDANEKAAAERRHKWVLPDRDGVSYSVDTKNLTVTFEQPQFRQKNTLTGKDKDRLLKTIGEKTFQTIASREVYMTATFSTDVAAVFGSRATGGYIELLNGAPFSAYVQARNQDIIFHQNAWYPISNKDKDILSPTSSTDTCDGHQVGDSIRACTAFDNYRQYIGEGHWELARALLNWKEGFLLYTENVSAQLPYFEIDYVLGDTLTEIANTNYNALGSYLLGIVWQRVSDTDMFTTGLEFSNHYGTNRSNIDFAPQKHSENKNRFNIRTAFDYINEQASGAIPTL